MKIFLGFALSLLLIALMFSFGPTPNLIFCGFAGLGVGSLVARLTLVLCILVGFSLNLIFLLVTGLIRNQTACLILGAYLGFYPLW